MAGMDLATLDPLYLAVWFLILSFAVYRFTQLVVWDVVWESSREKLIRWLEARDGTPRVTVQDENGMPMVLTLPRTQRRSFGQFVAWKAAGALSCPYCFSAYSSAGAALFFQLVLIRDWSWPGSLGLFAIWFGTWGVQSWAWSAANPEKH